MVNKLSHDTTKLQNCKPAKSSKYEKTFLEGITEADRWLVSFPWTHI